MTLDELKKMDGFLIGLADILTYEEYPNCARRLGDVRTAIPELIARVEALEGALTLVRNMTPLPDDGDEFNAGYNSAIEDVAALARRDGV